MPTQKSLLTKLSGPVVRSVATRLKSMNSSRLAPSKVAATWCHSPSARLPPFGRQPAETSNELNEWRMPRKPLCSAKLFTSPVCTSPQLTMPPKLLAEKGDGDGIADSTHSRYVSQPLQEFGINSHCEDTR